MFRQRAAAATLSAAFVAGLAGAGEAGAPASPFAVSVRAGLEAVRPGEELPVAVVLDIAERHKVYDEKAVPLDVGLAPGEEAGLVGDVARPEPHAKFDAATGRTRLVHEGRTVFTFLVEAPAPGPDRPGEVVVRIRVGFEGCSDAVCFLRETRTLELVVPVRAEGSPPIRANEDLFRESPRSAVAEAPGDFTGRNPIVAVLFAFLFGVMLSFTPCVYPLVPVTLAVIGARSAGGGWKRGLALSLIYVLGLSATYTALGVAAAKGGSTVGATSQHWAAVTAVAAILLALAASLFGVYDLEMPASWRARLRLRRKAGPLGVFAMGLLSGLVATPCVAAPLYTVLAFIARTGSVVLGGAMLFAMAWGMGVLLILAGTSSGLQSRLPKAGGWMLGVKTALGVIVVLAALYFLRALLPARAFTAWLAAPLVLLGVWRGVVVRTAPDAPRGALALRAAGITALVFGAYLGVGALVRAGVPAPAVSYMYPDEIVPSPSRIEFRKDYAAALGEARAAGRPVMLDFIKPNCPGCRELERDVFSREDVAREAGRFVCVRVDIDDPPVPVEALKAAYGIVGAPTVVWLDGEGDPLRDLTVAEGGISPEEFLRRMREAR